MKFIRLRRKGRKNFLETAKASYRNPRFSGTKLTLYGVSHIGEHAYYCRIQGDLSHENVVLYEYMADGDGLPKASKAPHHGIVARFMGLSSQIESLDYTHPNFIHADMTLAELKQRCGTTDVKEILGGIFNIPATWIKAAARVYAWAPVRWLGRGLIHFGCLAAKLNPSLTNRVKARLAKTLDMDESWSCDLSESDPKRVILYERNKIVWETAKAEIEKGKKNVAILYGAAHMPDIDARLRDEGWEQEDFQWMTVWRYQEKRRIKIGKLAYAIPDNLPDGFGTF